MLIKVFGIWLMASNISHLREDSSYYKNRGECTIVMNSKKHHYPNIKDCDEVAEIINKQIEANE